MYDIGIDIGGTSIKIGIVDKKSCIVSKTSIPFVHEGEEVVADNIAAATMKLLDEQSLSLNDIDNVGAIVPGSVDTKIGMVIDAYNLDFHNVCLETLLEERFPRKRVRIANDADGAALAELRTGAFRGYKSGVLITLGTGIGGGIIMNGKIFTGGKGLGSELGHIYLVEGGEHCTCGKDGCFEAYSSATALIREGRKIYGDGPEVDAKYVVDKAKEGDERAIKVFDEYIDHLGSGIASIFNIMNPEVIALGGGLSGAGDFLFVPLRENAYKKFFFKERCEIVPATAGNDAGVIGAASL